MELSSQSDEEEEEGELITQYVEPLSIKANQTHIWASTNAVGTVRIRNKYTLALQKALALESSFKEKRSGVVEAVPRCQSIASCRTSWKKNQSHRFSQHHVTAFDFSLVRGDRTRTRGRTSSSIFCSTRLDVKSSSRHTLKKSSVLQNEKNVADLKLDRSIGKNSSMPRSAGSEKSQDSRGASKFRGNDFRGIKLLETDKMHTMYSAFFSDFYDIFAEAGPTRRASSKYLREREILLEMKSLISAWADEHRVLQSLPADCDHLIEDSDEDSNNWTITRKPMTANTKIDIRHITFSKFENDPTKNHEIQSEVTYKVQRTREDLHRILPIVLSQIHEPGPWRESKGALFNLQWTWNKGNRNPFTVGKYHLFCQLMNHIPGSALLTRKDSLAKRLSKLNRVTDPIFSHKNWMERAGQICTCSNNIAALDTKRNIQDALTRIIPHTFVLPGDEKALWMFLSSGQSSDRTTALSGEFSGRMKQDRSQRMAPLKNAENLWILKPVGLSRGRGIEVVPESALVKNFSNLSAWISSSCGMSNSSHTFVVQQYIDRPYLIEGRKFDLRVYVLVVQFSPLEAFVSNLGYVRFATHTYSTENASLSSRLAHLTNTELAKDTGTQATFKWELQRLHKYFMGLGTHWPDIWKCVQDIILKSLVCVEPDIPMRPNAFELFGYDILLDDHLKPWLIEVNASPSLEMSCDLDRDVKPHLLIDTIRLLDPIPFDRLALLDVVERRLAENLTHNPYKAMQHGSNNQNHNSIISSNKCTEGMITGTTSQMSDSSYAENNVAERNKSSKTWNHLELDLQKIFKGRLPRRYGEMPFAIGNYERIAPSERYSSLSKILNSQTTNFSPKKVMKPYKMKLNC